jgi:hypothetical protein
MLSGGISGSASRHLYNRQSIFLNKHGAYIVTILFVLFYMLTIACILLQLKVLPNYRVTFLFPQQSPMSSPR